MKSEYSITKDVSITSLLKWVATVVPIIVGSLFFAGTLYLAYYHMYWGLSPNMFAASFQTTVTYGVLAFADLSLRNIESFLWLGIFIIIYYIFCHLLGMAFSKLFEKFKWNIKTNKSLRTWFPIEIFPLALFSFSVFLLVITALVIALSGFRFAFAKVGEKTAEIQHARLISEEDDGGLPDLVKVKFISSVDFDESLRRQLIFCTPNDCVFLLSSGVEVIARSSILSISIGKIQGVSKETGEK